MSRYLVCLLAWVTRVFSSVGRTTSRRGKPTSIVPAPDIRLDEAFLQQLADDYRRTMDEFGWSLRSVPTAPRRTAGTTAATTTTGTGGSPGPGSAGVGPFGMCMYPRRKTRPD